LEQVFSGTVTVSGTTTVGSTVVPCSAGRIGQYLKVTAFLHSSSNATSEPLVTCTVDGTGLDGITAGKRLQRSVSASLIGVSFRSEILVSTASNKTVTLALGGGAAGSWTLAGLVEVG
jgi:hypothetical protein